VTRDPACEAVQLQNIEKETQQKRKRLKMVKNNENTLEKVELKEQL